MSDCNIANSVFKNWNDSEGIMICGYEWGYSKKDQSDDLQGIEGQRKDVDHVFSNKAAAYGAAANNWRYDQTIIKWFDMWGHPLRRDDLGGDFEKCLLQTNWCNSQDHHISQSYDEMLLADAQVRNFIWHIEKFKPKLIIFCGSAIIRLLQNAKVLPLFKSIMGEVTNPLRYLTKPFDGRKFRVGFQGFERCNIVCLPHPSGSHGLHDEYIKLFEPEIGVLIEEVKKFKRVS